MKKLVPKKKGSLLAAHSWLWVMIILAAILYSNTLNNGYVLDDYGVLKDNWVVKKGFEGIPTILKTPYRFGVGNLSDQIYRPLSLVMFALEWQVAPDKPGVSHLVNVLFYAFSCGLLYLVLRKLFSRYHPLLPLFACLLWLAHPIHTEVVANIKSRDEIMSAFFLFLSILGFLGFLDQGRKSSLAGSVVAYFLAFLSKEGVITFLVLFPLIGWFYTNARPKRILAAASWMILPAALYFMIRQAVLKGYAPATVGIPVVDNLLVAAPDMASRMATAVLILGKYLLKLIFPVTLVSDYSYNQIPVIGWSDPLALLSLLVYGAAVGFCIWKFRGKSPVMFGTLLFLVTISVYSNIFTLIGSSFAERFLFLPSLGFAIVLANAILMIFKLKLENPGLSPAPSPFRGAQGPWMLLGLILVLYSYKTVSRNAEWESQRTLFSEDVKRSPNSAHMHYYWGLTLRDEAKAQTDQASFMNLMGQALREFNTAVSIYPDYADSYGQIGLAYYRLGNNEEALRNYERALKLDPVNAVFYANQGIIFYNQGNLQKALELYKKSVALDPNYGDGYLNLGSTYGMMHQYEPAIQNFRKALEYLPENPKIYYYIGISYQSLGKPGEARPYLDKAYQMDPTLKK